MILILYALIAVLVLAVFVVVRIWMAKERMK